ncbi:UNVERIFIED_CONTAM: hypothetical protein O8I53_13720 [Campylobacter lari]
MKKNKLLFVPLAATSLLSTLNLSAVRSSETDPTSSKAALYNYLESKKFKPGVGGISQAAYNAIKSRIDRANDGDRYILGNIKGPQRGSIDDTYY